MANTDPLSTRDLEELSRAGITRSEFERQLDLLRHPPRPAHLLRPCRPGDGILQISEEQQTDYVERWRSLCRDNHLVKFVPASGAATRMFKDLAVPSATSSQFYPGRFADSFERFPFHEELKERLREQGLHFDSLVERQQFEPIIAGLLGSPGLGYDKAPKGLILFHRYPEGPRTALEEQLREGYGYLTASEADSCRFHFTVTEAHQASFQNHIERFRAKLEGALGVTLEVGFSTQSPSSDTVAIDSRQLPVRRPDGSLLLRPAGHGALLQNLQNLDADVVFIKNIDNVSHLRLHPISIHWKRVLAGYFATTREHCWGLLNELDQSPADREVLNQALRFMRERLAIEVPVEIFDSTLEVQCQYAAQRLDRPLRVCGMVRNEGEPGGGPFWLTDRHGGGTGQIVESAQVDLQSREQTEIWQSSTHFNPVDLVCGLRNRHGQAYRLADFVDPTTSFVTEKSQAGEPIKVLERPGLWNGSMAGWNTAFVEVPIQTFTPVKTVFDLLRPEHQP